MSQKRKKTGLEGTRNAPSKIQEGIDATVDTLQGQIVALEKRIDRMHRNRWRSFSLVVNVVTIVALVSGAYFQIWLNRPVVDFQLTSPSSYYVAPDPQVFFFEAQNTGQTDITLDVTIVAINSLVSTSQTGPFGPNATAREFLQARSSWGTWSFYFKANASAANFTLYIAKLPLAASPDILTTLLDESATYNRLNLSALVWVRQQGPYAAANAYTLQG